jgi:hypothetical protein
MKTDRKRSREKDAASLAEKAFQIESTELVNKRLAMSIAMCPECAMPAPRKGGVERS